MDPEKPMPVMSLLEICNNLFAGVPLLSEHQYQLLFQLDEQLTDSGVQTNLSSMAHQQNSLAENMSSTMSAGNMSSTEMRSDCSHQRDDESICLPCNDLEKKRKRWETLFEQYKEAKRASATQNMTCSDLRGGDAGGGEQYTSEAVAMNPLLHLQGWKYQIPEQPLDSGTAPPASLKHTQPRPQTQSALLLSSEENSDSAITTADIPPVTRTNEEQAALTPGRVAPPNSPAQYPQTDATVQGVTEYGSDYRIHWPSISFLSQNHKIHFPEISYFLEDNMRLSGLQAPEMIHYINDLNWQDTTPTTSSNCDALVPLQSNPSTTPIASNLIHDHNNPEQSGLKSTPKKGTQLDNQKTHIPTRRWSQTYLNGLIHKHQPRNLPDGLRFTDHTNVQEIPLESLVPPIKAIDVEVDGEIRFLGAGTRVEVPSGDEYGWTECSGDDVFNKTQRIIKQTPFRVVTMDKEGRILVDMNWAQDVVPDDQSVSDLWNSELEKHSHLEGGGI